MGSNPISLRAQEFLALSTRQDLANWLGVDDRRLRYILYALPSAEKYRTFVIKKRNGADRIIEAPHPALKELQRKLLSVLMEIAPSSGIAKGYVKNRGTIDHAWMHRRRKFVVLADIKDFFPTITFPRVRGALLAKPFGLQADVATCVAQLCCKDSVLPQGAPTSPLLSNLICRSLDHGLLALAKKLRMSVSRYADDMCFSTSKSTLSPSIAVFDGMKWVAGEELRNVVAGAGFSLNDEKFKVRGEDVTQLVTGLVVNRGVSLPRRWRRQLRVKLHLIKKHEISRAEEIVKSWVNPSAARQGFSSLEKIVRGKAHFAQYVDLRSGRTFAESLYRSYPDLRGLLPRPLKGTPFRLMAEGKTDLLHLESAHRALKSAGEFAHLRPRFSNFRGDNGDIELMKTLQRIAKSDIPELTIGLFDCDNDKFMRAEGLAPGAFNRIGSNVYAACLAPPPRLAGKDFCIELLFDRRQLCTNTAESRRIFLPDEFDVATGLSSDGVYRRAVPGAKSLIVGDRVTREADGHSSLLSKADFAEMVHTSSAPFDMMNFEGFRPTFTLLGEITDFANDS